MNNETEKEQDYKYPDIDMDGLVREWNKAKEWRSRYTSQFRELDKLKDGVPLNHDGKSPYVGDTTIAGLVRSIPRDSLKQLPVFSAVVNGSKTNIAAIICSYLLRSVVFNEDTFGKGILSTMQIGAEEAFTHGYANFMTATTSMYSKFGTSMRLMHYSDVSPEPGISADEEATYWYVDADVTKSRLKQMLKSAQNNPDSSWDPRALEELLKLDPETINKEQLNDERMTSLGSKGTNGTYKFTTRYEVGEGGEFVTFCKQLPDHALRLIKNRSKFGFPRVQLLVIDPAAQSPFGVSRVRIAAPNQNVMNAYYMNITALLLYNSKPALFQKGQFKVEPQLKQGVKWVAKDKDAEAKLVTMGTETLQYFPQFAQQFGGQIQNILGGKTGAVNAGTKSGFGKTAPGEQRAQAFEDSATNQLTNILENFSRQYALVGLDTYLSEQEGEDTLILDDEAKNDVNQFLMNNAQPGEQVPQIGSDNRYQMNWEEFYFGKLTDPENPESEREGGIEHLRVEIELSMGKDELNEKKRADLQDTLVTLEQNQDPNDPGKAQVTRELENKLLQDTVPDAKPLPMGMPAPTEVDQSQMSPTA